jgi:hypothetical protein
VGNRKDRRGFATPSPVRRPARLEHWQPDVATDVMGDRCTGKCKRRRVARESTHSTAITTEGETYVRDTPAYKSDAGPIPLGVCWMTRVEALDPLDALAFAHHGLDNCADLALERVQRAA